MFNHRIRSAHEPEVYIGPVGQCIYCPSQGALTDEHIVPDGLGGDLVLTAASCTECAKKTGQIEQYVLRTILGQARGALGIRSRKSIKQKRARLDRALIQFGGIESTDFRSVEFTDDTPFIVPTFLTDGLPGVLRDPQVAPFELRLNVVAPPDLFERGSKLVGPDGKLGFRARFDFRVQAQMYAKIAHAYAVSQLGVAGFEPLLREYIVADQTPAVNTFLIGSENDVEAFYSLHDLKLMLMHGENPYDPNWYWGCAIKLFSFLSTPTVLVVVGRSFSPPQGLAARGRGAPTPIAGGPGNIPVRPRPFPPKSARQ